jgi:hypothetical protein
MIKNECHSRIHTNQRCQKSFSNFKYRDIIVKHHLEDAKAKEKIKSNPSDTWFEGVNYEACPESKDTNFLNMYGIFNSQKRHCE